MTSSQKAWLDGHPAYSVVGALSGNVRYERRRVLLPDGHLAGPRTAQPHGAFMVGVRVVGEPGSVPDPRADMEATKA